MRPSNFVDMIFSNVASRYDVMNDLMSLRIHRWWKKKLLDYLTNPRAKLLDVAAGTGDIGLAFYRKARKDCQPQVTLYDANEAMLELASSKAVNENMIQGITYATGPAESLPFPESTFDYYTISFGLRNVQDIDQALSEAYRVLKPGATFFCMEFSQVNMPGLKELYQAYSKVIPPLGGIVTGHREAYQYLVDSIAAFPDRFSLSLRMRSAGFKIVNFTTLSFGVVAIHVGHKSD